MNDPAGLATISGAMDDTPNARGAVLFCRSLAERRDAETRVATVPDRVFTDHAALVVSAAYRSADTRAIVFRADGRIEAVG